MTRALTSALLWMTACTTDPAQIVIDRSQSPADAVRYVVEVVGDCLDVGARERFEAHVGEGGSFRLEDGDVILRARAYDASCFVVAEVCEPWTIPVRSGREIRLTPRPTLRTPFFSGDCGPVGDAGARPDSPGPDVCSVVACYDDNDSDDYAALGAIATFACTCPPRTTSRSPTPDESDCDDLDAAVNPGMPELCDGIDTNCDGSKEDEDMDGALAPDAPCSGGTLPRGDCQDEDPLVVPGQDRFFDRPYCSRGLSILCFDGRYRCDDCDTGPLADQWDYDCDGDVSPRLPGTCATDECDDPGSMEFYPARVESSDRCGEQVEGFWCMFDGDVCRGFPGSNTLSCR